MASFGDAPSEVVDLTPDASSRTPDETPASPSEEVDQPQQPAASADGCDDSPLHQDTEGKPETPEYTEPHAELADAASPQVDEATPPPAASASATRSKSPSAVEHPASPSVQPTLVATTPAPTHALAPIVTSVPVVHRASFVDVLARPNVQRKADTEATVYKPLHGTHGRMFDETHGSVLIEDYSATAASDQPTEPPTPSPDQSSQRSSQRDSPVHWHSGPPLAGADASSSTPTPSLGIGSLIGSLGAMMFRSKVEEPVEQEPPTFFSFFSAPPSTLAPQYQVESSSTSHSAVADAYAASASTSPSPPPTPPPASSTTPPDSATTEQDDPNDGTPAILGFVPLPSETELEQLGLSSVAELYDPALTQRGDRWRRCLNPQDLRRRFAPGMYLKLLKSGSGPGGVSEYSTKIRKDLRRTFPHARLFTTSYGRAALYNALAAFAAYDMPTGYSQGMAFVVGIMLLHFGPPVPDMPQPIAEDAESEPDAGAYAGADTEATADAPLLSVSSTIVATGGESEELLFWSLVQLMHGGRHNLRSLYTDDCVGLRASLHVLEQALVLLDPTLSDHLVREGVEPSLYATQWFLCVFSYRFPLPFASAAFDHFLNLGQIYLIQLAVAILRHTRTTLLSRGFEGIVPFLAALPGLPTDLPDRAAAEIDIPTHLADRVQTTLVTSASFKSTNRRR